MTNLNKAAAMTKVWEGRRAWQMAPVCCCGCDTRLEVAEKPDRQKYFAQGHDARLKSILRKVLAGQMKRADIPQAARTNLARLKFVQASPEFKRAFARPGQRQLRGQAKMAIE
jgi:hypothetical protein